LSRRCAEESIKALGSALIAGLSSNCSGAPDTLGVSNARGLAGGAALGLAAAGELVVPRAASSGARGFHKVDFAGVTETLSGGVVPLAAAVSITENGLVVRASDGLAGGDKAGSVLAAGDCCASALRGLSNAGLGLASAVGELALGIIQTVGLRDVSAEALDTDTIGGSHALSAGIARSLSRELTAAGGDTGTVGPRAISSAVSLGLGAAAVNSGLLDTGLGGGVEVARVVAVASSKSGQLGTRRLGASRTRPDTVSISLADIGLTMVASDGEATSSIESDGGIVITRGSGVAVNAVVARALSSGRVCGDPTRVVTGHHSVAEL